MRGLARAARLGQLLRLAPRPGGCLLCPNLSLGHPGPQAAWRAASSRPPSAACTRWAWRAGALRSTWSPASASRPAWSCLPSRATRGRRRAPRARRPRPQPRTTGRLGPRLAACAPACMSMPWPHVTHGLEPPTEQSRLCKRYHGQERDMRSEQSASGEPQGAACARRAPSDGCRLCGALRLC